MYKATIDCEKVKSLLTSRSFNQTEWAASKLLLRKSILSKYVTVP
jgi:hypothetical protein